jgi:hypothetical protein
MGPNLHHVGLMMLYIGLLYPSLKLNIISNLALFEALSSSKVRSIEKCFSLAPKVE